MTAPILLIDDSQDIREAFKILMELEGFDVITRESATEALEALASGELKPSFIILDLTMPDMDGREFLRQKKERNIATDIPVVVFSAHTQTEPLEGTVGWARKPIDIDNMISIIRRNLKT